MSQWRDPIKDNYYLYLDCYLNVLIFQVKNHTNGLITDLVSADMFNALTRVAFFNCMYFLVRFIKFQGYIINQ